MVRNVMRLGLVTLLVVGMGVLGASADRYGWKTTAVQRLEPDADHAVVYFIKTGGLGSGVYLWTFVDRDLAVVLLGRSYGVVRVPVGDHVLWARAENVSALPLHAEAGRTYYVREKVSMGLRTGRVRLRFMNKEEGERALQRVNEVFVLTEEGREFGLSLVEQSWWRARRRAARRR